jgi:Tol biopolymer transport system component
MWRLVCVAVLAGVLVPAAGEAAPTSETHNPVWSPDGSRLAYVRAVRSTGRVFVVSANGSGNSGGSISLAMSSG